MAPSACGSSLPSSAPRHAPQVNNGSFSQRSRGGKQAGLDALERGSTASHAKTDPRGASLLALAELHVRKVAPVRMAEGGAADDGAPKPKRKYTRRAPLPPHMQVGHTVHRRGGGQSGKGAGGGDGDANGPAAADGGGSGTGEESGAPAAKKRRRRKQALAAEGGGS